MKTMPKLTYRLPLFALLFGLVLALGARVTMAALPTPPDKMAYQGFLVDANGVALAPTSPGNYPVVFRIYDASTGGNIIWSEQQIVTVDKGNFSVVLGEGTEVSGEARPALSTAFTGATASDRYLGITVTVNSVAKTLAPRLRWLPSPYAFTATAATSLVNNSGQTLLTLANGKLEGTSELTLNPGPLTVTGNATVSGSATFGSATVSGALAVGSLTLNPGPLTVTGNATVSGALAVAGQSSLTGNVGIGTTSPRARLEVDGNIILRGAGGNTWSNQRLLWGGDGTGNALSFASINNVGTINTPVLTMLDNGNVGIGTTAAAAKLHVAGGNMKIDGSHYIEFGAGVAGKNGDAGKMGYATFTPNPMLDIVGASPTGSNTRYVKVWDALYIAQWAVSPSFQTSSDARIKKITDRPVGETSLESIRRLQVTDFRFVDTKGQRQTPRRGFIAQEIEKILPNAISQSTDFVPDIYAQAITSEYEASEKTLTIELKDPHGLNLDDIVRLNLDKDQKAAKVNSVPSPTRFVVEAESEPGSVFVFGKQVSDFRTVDYDHVFATGISAIQEMDRQVQALKKSEARIAELETKASKVDALEREVSELRKLVVELASATRKASEPVAAVSSQREAAIALVNP